MRKLLIIFLLAVVSVAFSKSLTVTKVDREINDLLFNGQWKKSDSLISVQLRKSPNSVKYNFMKAYNYYYARYFANDAFDRNRTLELVKHYTWKAINQGEKIEGDTESKFYLGCSYAYLSRANAMQQEYWLAYWNGGEAEDLLEEVIEEDPTIVDAYLNLGVNEYYPAVAITGFTSFLA